jgi:hypothetical protein
MIEPFTFPVASTDDHMAQDQVIQLLPSAGYTNVECRDKLTNILSWLAKEYTVGVFQPAQHLSCTRARQVMQGVVGNDTCMMVQ